MAFVRISYDQQGKAVSQLAKNARSIEFRMHGLLKGFDQAANIIYERVYLTKVADVSEAVRQCADALMLSGESAMRSYGQKVTSVKEFFLNLESRCQIK
ncbi:hypothetical protein Tco_0427777 [Tanacetum coccineum]